MRDAFPHAMFNVMLGHIQHPDDLLSAISEGLPFHMSHHHYDLHTQLLKRLQAKQQWHALLLLDQFDVQPNNVQLISELLTANANLSLLITAQEPLGLPEEYVLTLAGLSYHTDATIETEALHLFEERLQLYRSHQGALQNRAALAELGTLVEGMPLAIELLAANLPYTDEGVQGCKQYLATHSTPDGSPMQAVFAYCWEALPSELQGLFVRLSTFTAPFTAEAAEAVAQATPDSLQQLIKRGIISSRIDGRYEMHTLLQAFAERTGTREECALSRQRFVTYYLGLLHRLEPDLKCAKQLNALDTIGSNFAHIRQAWRWAFKYEALQPIEQAAESLHWFAHMRGRYYEVVELFQHALAQLDPHNPEHEVCRFRLEARLIRLHLLANHPNTGDAQAKIDACLTAARQRSDDTEIGFCFLVAGMVALSENRLPAAPNDTAAGFLRESYALYKRLHDPFYEAEALHWLAATSPNQEFDSPSNAFLQQSYELRQQIGDTNGLAWLSLNLAELACSHFDYLACDTYARQALTCMRDIGSVKGTLSALAKVCQTTLMWGEFEEGWRLALQLRELAEESNDDQMLILALGLQAFAISVFKEDYAYANTLVQQQRQLAETVQLWNHNELGMWWGAAIAACGLGHSTEARQFYPTLFWSSFDDPATGAACLAFEAFANADLGEFTTAAELLGLALRQSPWLVRWLEQWPLIQRLQAELARQLGQRNYDLARERGSRFNLALTLRVLLFR